ncbi:hypothetical protein FKM95_000255 [Candidatus Tremblaya phenacola]|nr:hypothetical protein FKM95_000255 [Candidatus Tremblaya phenacola]
MYRSKNCGAVYNSWLSTINGNSFGNNSHSHKRTLPPPLTNICITYVE